MSEIAVMGEQEGAEHTALELSGVWGNSGLEYYTMQLDIGFLHSQVHGGNCIECWAEIHKILMKVLLFSKKTEWRAGEMVSSVDLFWCAEEPVSHSTPSEWRWAPQGSSRLNKTLQTF